MTRTTKPLKSLIDREIEKLQKVRACEHEWTGPIEHIVLDNVDGKTHYFIRCKKCPLKRAFANLNEAEEAINE